MDLETIIVGLVAWGLGNGSGKREADRYIQDAQARENKMLREVIMEMAKQIEEKK